MGERVLMWLTDRFIALCTGNPVRSVLLGIAVLVAGVHWLGWWTVAIVLAGAAWEQMRWTDPLR